MLASEYNLCQSCSSSQKSIFAENTLKLQLVITWEWVIKIWKKIHEFILIIRETKYVKMNDFWKNHYSMLPDSYKKWLLRKAFPFSKNWLNSPISNVFSMLSVRIKMLFDFFFSYLKSFAFWWGFGFFCEKLL